MPPVALRPTKWLLDAGARFVKATVRIHNLECLAEDMAVILVANRCTRLESLLLPYVFHKYAGLELWSLAASELFQGRIARYLQSVGAISTNEPEDEKPFLRSLLVGDHPWFVGPDSTMAGNRPFLDARGLFEVYSGNVGNPSGCGAGALALEAALARRTLARLAGDGGQPGLSDVLKRFDLQSADDVLRKRTVIVPVNISYFPLRPETNAFPALAKEVMKDRSLRAVDELSVEETVLAQDGDIDIVLGDPIDVGRFLEAPEYADVMVGGDAGMDFPAATSKELFQETARRLTVRHMEDAYALTMLNHSHIFAGLLQHQRGRTFTDYELRSRAFLAVEGLKELDRHRLHPRLAEGYSCLAFGGPCSELRDFLDACVREGILRESRGGYIRTRHLRASAAGLRAVRKRDVLQAAASELDPADEACVVSRVAAVPADMLRKRMRRRFLEQDRGMFEADYAQFALPDESKATEVGAPFLLEPRHIRGGVVLVHGYMAAPLEVRALGEYLSEQGFLVYGARLKGHGTAPEDLARTKWDAWRASVDRAFAVVRSYTDTVVFGGFSMGGVFALLAAAEKQVDTRGVFAISAPLELRSYGARLASSVVTMNTLLNRFSGRDAPWYVENEPENPHINYLRNPIAGVNELGKAMKAMESVLPEITAPALVIQGDGDPTVHPHSAQRIFEQLGSETKELIMLHRANHGIVNGPGSREVFEQVCHFLGFLEEEAYACEEATLAGEKR